MFLPKLLVCGALCVGFSIPLTIELIKGGSEKANELVSGGGGQQFTSHNLSDSWKLKVIEPIEVSYSCKGDGNFREKISGTFKVKVNAGAFNNKEEKLIKKERVDVGIGYEFNVENAKDSLRGLGKKEAWMNVSKVWDGGLRILLKEDNKASYWKASDVNLICEIDSKNGIVELQEYKNSHKIFSGKIGVDESQGTVTLKGWSGNLKASLHNCQFKGRVGDETSCDIKLSSGWMWHIKATQKAKFEISPAKP